jgi:DNA-binding NtrC family response regulator
VTINCGAVPEQLLESELFGHVRGAFTGADRDRVGLFESARGGTLFLDESGEMPLAMQVKLLRVLQEREVRAVGATRATKIDVRVVCATNRDLRAEIEAGRFREDLYYRIGVVDLDVPPLRARSGDIPLLAAHALIRIAEAQEREPAKLTPSAVRRLLSYDWPGNVRELENVLTNALLMSPGKTLGAQAIQLRARPRPARKSPLSRSQFRQRERDSIVTALDVHDWNVSKVARALGMHRSTLYRKLERYELLPT